MLPASCDESSLDVARDSRGRGKMRLTVATSSSQRLKPDTFFIHSRMPEGIP